MKIKPNFCIFIILLIKVNIEVFAKKTIHIDKILVNNTLGKLNFQNNTIKLKAFEKSLILEFGKLQNDSVMFFYRINQSSFWHQSKFPIVQFHDIEGGSHILEAKIKTNNVFSDTHIFKIEKDQDFYQKAWFWPSIGGYILLIFGIAAYLFSLYDFRNKLKVQFMRNQIASDLHDEVGSNLNSIAIFIEVLKKKVRKENPELLNILDKISMNSEETVALMRDTVWSINPLNDGPEKLFDRMKSHGYEVITAKNIKFKYENTIEIAKLNLSMEQRRNLYLIYKEALNNILKHAKASIVQVNIGNDQNKIQIQISDNGIGFDRSKVFEGNGLKNFESRGNSNGVKVAIDSILDKGTTVEITVMV